VTLTFSRDELKKRGVDYGGIDGNEVLSLLKEKRQIPKDARFEVYNVAMDVWIFKSQKSLL
jgi:hypothetical protein